jgi:Tfp pilus assembly protein PilO
MLYIIVLIVVLIVILGFNAKKERKIEPVKEEPQSHPVNEPLKQKPVVTVTVQHDEPQESKVKQFSETSSRRI